MNITSLLDHNKTSHPEASTAVIEDAPLEHLPLGTNMEATPVKDLVRMPGTKWCGIGWRTDTVQQFGGYAGTDRCAPPSTTLPCLQKNLIENLQVLPSPRPGLSNPDRARRDQAWTLEPQISHGEHSLGSQDPSHSLSRENSQLRMQIAQEPPLMVFFLGDALLLRRSVPILLEDGRQPGLLPCWQLLLQCWKHQMLCLQDGGGKKC